MVSLPVVLLGRAYGADMGKRPFGPDSLRRTKIGDETVTPAPPTYTDKNGVLWVIFTREGGPVFPYLFSKKYKAHSYGYAAKGWAEKDLEADYWLGELKIAIDTYASTHELPPVTYVPKIDPATGLPSPTEIGKSIGSAIPAPTTTTPAIPPSKPPPVISSSGGTAPVPAGSPSGPKPSEMAAKVGEATSPGLLVAAIAGAAALGWVLLK